VRRYVAALRAAGASKAAFVRRGVRPGTTMEVASASRGPTSPPCLLRPAN